MVKESLPVTIGMIINQYSDAFLKRSRGCIRIASYISEADFDELLDDEIPELEDVKIDLRKEIHRKNDFTLWNYAIRREVRGREVRGSFLALQVGSFVYLLTGHQPSFLRKGIMYIAKQMYPSIMVTYITAKEINEILKNFAGAKDKELFYSKFVAKRVFGKRFTYLGYTYGPYVEAFKKAREERPRLWIDSIRIFSKNGTEVDFHLSRGGHLTYYKGNFEEYYEHILAPMQDYCSRRLKTFENRGRKETKEKELRPLLIQYESKIFDEPSARKQLINVIAKYDYCNFSVIHKGNPHVYLNIVDRVDNSTFSMRTYGSDSLVIAPQVKATKASLMRFSKHLMDKFLEGKISDISN